MDIGSQIKQLRTDNNLRQKELASKIGVSSQAVSMWEAGTRSPNSGQRKKLCEYFKISEGVLFGAISQPIFPVTKIPIISWAYANRFYNHNYEFPQSIIEGYVYSTAEGSDMFSLRVSSDSMSPEFVEGDIIVVDPHQDVQHGDYVVVSDRDSSMARFKQYKKYGNKVVLHPLNPKCEDIELNEKKRYVIIGKIVAKEKRY